MATKKAYAIIQLKRWKTPEMVAHYPRRAVKSYRMASSSYSWLQ